MSVKEQRGIYQSRKRGIWRKGESSGAVQELLKIRRDCDDDALCFVVKQTNPGFCHLNRWSCFGVDNGLSKLARTLQERKATATEGSYTNRLFNDSNLLNSKLREEIEELIEASTKDEVEWEAADVIYFTLVRAVSQGTNNTRVTITTSTPQKPEHPPLPHTTTHYHTFHVLWYNRMLGVTLEDISKHLDMRSLKVTRRPGDAKPPKTIQEPTVNTPVAAAATPVASDTPQEFEKLVRKSAQEVLSQSDIDPVDPTALKIAKEIVEDIGNRGEAALTHHCLRLGDIKVIT